MKLIKLSLVALATIFTFGVSTAQVSIQAGYSNQISTTSGAATHPIAHISIPVENTTTLNGFYVGVAYEMNVQGPVGLTYGLTYNYLTGDSKYTKPTVETKDAVGHRLDLPVRIQGDFPLSEDIKLLVFAGPNFTMSLGQKVGDVNLADEMTLAGDKKKWNAFDLQLGGGLGLKFKSVTLKASYDWGMLNRINEPGVTTKGNDIRVGLSYNF